MRRLIAEAHLLLGSSDDDSFETRPDYRALVAKLRARYKGRSKDDPMKAAPEPSKDDTDQNQTPSVSGWTGDR